jgi:FtsP/CotA-like multicopper oxidase with cupredoxin domain
MGEAMRAVCLILLLGLVASPSTASAADSVAAAAGCGPAPTMVENPPEMARVPGRVQSLDLEVRQDGERLCFVDRNNIDRPGIAPTIRIRPGETLRVRLFNRINDASVLRQTTPPGHATSYPGVAAMPGYFDVVPGAYHEPTANTNLHFHGLEVKPVPCGAGQAPGDDVLSTYFAPDSAKPPPSGTCQSAYEIAIPESQPAGLYWYHTHFHGESEAQTLLGLSGAIVVENADDDARRQQGISDRVLIIRDHLATEPEHRAAAKPATGGPSAPARPSERPVAPPSATLGLDAELPQCAFGKCINTAAEVQCSAPADREQETFLSLNGISIRDERNAAGSVPELSLAADKEELWRVVNASADTYVRLHLVDLDSADETRTIPIAVTGLDGFPFADQNGQLKPATAAQPIPVPPGGRVEFKVRLDAAAAEHRFALRSEAVESGCSGDRMPARDLATLTIDKPSSGAPSGQASIPPRRALQGLNDMPLSATPARRRTFAFTEYQRAKNSKTDFYITEISRPDVSIEPFPMDGAPTSVVEVEADSVEEWTILNFTHEIHPFHIHQLHFRVLESDDKFVEGRMMDTINVPTALPEENWSPDDPVMPGRVRLLMRFHRNIAGEFVFHCHILGHEDKGMMGVIRVITPGADRASQPEPHQSMEHHH